MDEDRFNMAVRKFLKEVGVTSQRAIENAVRDAEKGGQLQGNEKLRAKMTLRLRRASAAALVAQSSDTERLWTGWRRAVLSSCARGTHVLVAECTTAGWLRNRKFHETMPAANEQQAGGI